MASQEVERETYLIKNAHFKTLHVEGTNKGILLEVNPRGIEFRERVVWLNIFTAIDQGVIPEDAKDWKEDKINKYLKNKVNGGKLVIFVKHK